MNSATQANHLMEVAQARQRKRSDLLHVGIMKLGYITFFYNDYYRVWGTTTECKNILGHYGIPKGAIHE